MLLFAAAAIAVSVSPTPPATSAGATVQAMATVRVISGVQLRLGEQNSSDVPAARDTVFNTGNIQQPAKLIEFQ